MPMFSYSCKECKTQHVKKFFGSRERVKCSNCQSKNVSFVIGSMLVERNFSDHDDKAEIDAFVKDTYKKIAEEFQEGSLKTLENIYGQEVIDECIVASDNDSEIAVLE